MSEFLFSNLKPILAGIVVPGLVLFIFIGFRGWKRNYSSGLDAIAGLSGLDFGLVGLTELLRQALSQPFRESAELVFVTLGLLGMLFFVVLLPAEEALSRYSAHIIAMESGCVLHWAAFPYFRFVLTWICALTILSLNVLIFFVKASG